MRSLIVLLFITLLGYIANVEGYTTSGKYIYDPNGSQVRLRGFDRPSLEWNTAGEYLSLSDYTLMKNWGSKVNVVRVSLNQASWLGSTSYQSTVDQQVTWIRSLGLGVILDLHWNDNGGQKNMADRTSITFWTSVANKYKSNPWVIFELYNEPHDISWSQWKNGDSTWAGMAEMYNAVRNAGASNMVIICGLNWAFDLSGVPSNAISGTNIAYGTHPYDYSGKQSGDWDAAFGNLAATYPVIMTEFGQYCNTNSYVQTLLTYAEGKGIHWTAWAWYVNGCSFPSIINDWSGNPSTVGAVVKSFLGTSSSGTSGSSSTTGSSSSPTLTVYTDSLGSNWQDWSWASTYSFSDTTYKHAGSYSIKFVATNYQGIYFHTTSTFSAGSYKAKFYVYSTAAIAKTNLGVLLYSTNNAQTGSTVAFPNAVAANAWTLMSVTLSSFGSSSTVVSGFAIQCTSSATVGTIWIDDVTISTS